MLMHTRGPLIMTEDATMLLTGKKALDFSGSVSAVDNIGIGGAEIGRAVVNFEGPIIFVVTARRHGGAYVLFSKALNENLHAAALEGTWIPGSTRPGSSSARAGPTIRKTSTNCIRRCTLRKQSALAQKFDSIHSVERARRVGSIDDIISLAELRPYLVRKVEEGMQRFSSSRKQ